MDLDSILKKIDDTINDYSIPRRLKIILARIKEDLVKEDQDLAVKITSVVYELDELSNDVNIPMHAKTALWDIISDLEALKG